MGPYASLMHRFRNLSIRTKITALLVAVVSFVLLISAVAFIVHDLRMLRRALDDHLETLAAVLADNSEAALRFEDRNTAEEILVSLGRDPRVVYARTFNSDGELFARYPSDGEDDPLPPRPGHERAFARDGFLHVFKDVDAADPLTDERSLGMLYLRASMDEFYEQMCRDIAIGAAILLVCVSVAVLLAVPAQRLISTPIRRLVDATQEISQHANFSVRVVKTSDDEIGVLIDGFNEMLSLLAARDAELAQHRQHLEEEVEQRTKRLQEVARELSRSNTELEQFAYIASHDLQEPLRMVRSYLQLLERKYRDRLDETADKYIDYAVDGASRMARMINDLLAYSRVVTRGKPIGPIDCEQAWAEALANLEKMIEESGAEVTHDPLPPVTADFGQMVQLFQNLIGNALKYRSDRPPKIHGSARQQEGQWLFSICDNGIGIEPQYAERVFVIFQRLHGRGAYSGTGIGLAVCKRIVERHGGSIWVESEYGNGSTFLFTIPQQQETNEKWLPTS
jgi:signal transduction histidine kinase